MYTKSIKQSQEVIPSSPNNWRNSIFITCSFAWFKWISQFTVYLIYLWNHSPLCLCFDPQMGWRMGKNSDFNQILGGPCLSIYWWAWWLSKSFNLPKNSFHFPFFCPIRLWGFLVGSRWDALSYFCQASTRFSPALDLTYSPNVHCKSRRNILCNQSLTDQHNQCCCDSHQVKRVRDCKKCGLLTTSYAV